MDQLPRAKTGYESRRETDLLSQVAQHIPEKRYESIAPEQTPDLTQARDRFDPVECRRGGYQAELIVGQYGILKLSCTTRQLADSIGRRASRAAKRASGSTIVNGLAPYSSRRRVALPVPAPISRVKVPSTSAPHARR